jgi:hypothetical protein
MKSKLIIIVAISLLVLTNSCTVYQPAMADIPLISKKHELRIDAGTTTNLSTNATISYGLTDKIAVQAFANTNATDNYGMQGALGYYKNVGENTIMEIYGGFRYSYCDAYNAASPGHLVGTYQTYFTQFNLGKINSKFAHMEYGIGIKAGMLHSDITDKNYYEYLYTSEPYPTYKDNSLLFEPTAFIRFGGERLKVNLKVGGCSIFKFTNTDKYIPYSQLNLGIGLNYRL